MWGKPFAVANATMAVLFAVSGLLQYNDPDPVRWVLLYLAACAACLMTGRGSFGIWPAAAVAAVALVWAATLTPILPQIRLNELARSMHAETPRIELSRELLGLAIVAGWMIVVALASRRRPRPEARQ